MSTQPLFDPASLQPLPCPVPGCQAIRLAGQEGRIVTCQHDLERDGRRPQGCLNTYRPEHAEVPY
ncbi:MAG: hypothetical protein VW362_07550 [Candidatus Nanopelagicales bacterium]